MTDTLLELNKKLEDSDAFTQATKLRNESKLWQLKYEVNGRKALKELMAQTYAFYCDMQKNVDKSVLVAKMRKHVVEVDEVQLKSDAKDTHILVRYVFSGFTDKQVSVYGTTLAKAHKAKVEADDFAQHVNDNMGFAGVASGKTAKKKGDGLSNDESLVIEGKAHLMQARARHAEFLGTNKKIEDWQEGEQYRMYVCVREQEGYDRGIALKELWLTETQMDEVLAMYATNLKQADKEVKKTNAGDENYKKQLAMANSEKANAEQWLENLKFDLPQAIKDGNRRLFVQLQDDKQKAEIQLEDANLKIAQLKKEKAQTA